MMQRKATCVLGKSNILIHHAGLRMKGNTVNSELNTLKTIVSCCMNLFYNLVQGMTSKKIKIRRGR